VCYRGISRPSQAYQTLGDQRYFSKIVNVSVRWRIYVVILLRRKAVHGRCKKRISERSDEKDTERGWVIDKKRQDTTLRDYVKRGPDASSGRVPVSGNRLGT
jgi:hypothetical protein